MCILLPFPSLSFLISFRESYSIIDNLLLHVYTTLSPLCHFSLPSGNLTPSLITCYCMCILLPFPSLSFLISFRESYSIIDNLLLHVYTTLSPLCHFSLASGNLTPSLITCYCMCILLPFPSLSFLISFRESYSIIDNLLLHVYTTSFPLFVISH